MSIIPKKNPNDLTEEEIDLSTDDRPLHQRLVDLIDAVEDSVDPSKPGDYEDVVTMATSFVDGLGDEQARCMIVDYLASLDQHVAATSTVLDRWNESAWLIGRGPVA